MDIHKWPERDFESWFKGQKQPCLPGGDGLLIVDRQRPIRRVVDLVCLDRDAQIVIIEVKNEATTRRTVGQALEYLASYDGVTLDDLAEEYPGDLQVAFEDRFGAPMRVLAAGRRVVLAAPAFDAPSALMTRWLNDGLAHLSVKFFLLEVRQTERGFKLTWNEGLRFVRARSIPQGIAVSFRDRLYLVLEPGNRPVVWHIGGLNASGRVRLPTGGTQSRPVVRITNGQRYLASISTPAAVKLERLGSCWQDRSNPQRCARILGVVRDTNNRDVAVFARFVKATQRAFGVRNSASFARLLNRPRRSSRAGT